MIAPLIKWDHEQDYMVAKFDASKDITSERKVTINLKEEDHQYMAGHIIDGKIHVISLRLHKIVVFECIQNE